MSRAPCIVCGGGYTASGIPGLLRCTRCAFTTADVALSGDDVARLYGAHYFAGEEYRDYIAERPLIEDQFRVRLKKLLRFVPDSHRNHLFEIGSAYGFFLSVAKDHFSSAEGIDVSREAADYARGVLGLPVHAGDFLEYEPREPAGVVCLWDTIEHLREPHLYIEKIARNMQPQGVLALTTGDIGSMMARLRGRRWRQIHPPTHLHYFSRVTLTRLLWNYGFEVVYCGHDGMCRSADTIAHIVFNVRHNWTLAYRILRRFGLLNWNVYLNFRDILFVIARKA